MSEYELRKFVTRSAPNYFFELQETIELIGPHDETDAMIRTQKALRSSYHSVLRMLGKESKSYVAEHFVRILNDGSESFVSAYIENFFEPSFLNVLDDQKRDYVEDYVMSRFRNTSSLSFIERMHRFHNVVTDQKFDIYISMLIGRYLHLADHKSKAKLRDMLTECLWMDHEFRVKEAKNYIEMWARRQKNDAIRQDLLSIIKDAEEIPF